MSFFALKWKMEGIWNIEKKQNAYNELYQPFLALNWAYSLKLALKRPPPLT